MATPDFKIFSANRLKFDELKEDAFSYLKKVYNTSGAEFTMASPFAQIITVTMHLGRMILFYIENVITEMNINTAFHARSVVGLATLTGHTPSLGIAARGSLNMSYNMNTDYMGRTVTIKNFTKIRNTANGLSYLAIFPGSNMVLSVGSSDSKIEIPIVQGELKYQQATGTGEALQSFNFANKKSELIDNFFINVYVNGERWGAVDSLLDMGYGEKVCMIKPSFNGGIDVFFGTGVNGGIPPRGASVLCEYLVCAGPAGNINETSTDNYWSFQDSGITSDGESVNLNNIYVLSSGSDIMFGSDEESLLITKKLAPHMSRSFVLANPVNYKYFLTRLNMFSIIDAFTGFNTNEDRMFELKYTDAKSAFFEAKEKYLAQVNLTGKDSDESIELYDEMVEKQKTMESWKSKYDDATLDDNIVYLYLVPDVTKRLNIGENYFTCAKSRFKLSDDEKLGILNLIEDSGQKIITVENKILDPVFVNFAINIFVQIWSNYSFSSVKSAIISAVSAYLLNNSRRDRIPVSDLVKIVEGVDGVDSVSIFFDADVNNQKYYGEGNYGLDGYGDVILSRTIKDTLGNSVDVNDLLPLFRGGFVSPNGVEYGEDINGLTSGINITLRGKTQA